MTIRRAAEREIGKRYAGPLAHLIDEVAERLHHSESMHLHDLTDAVGDCGYCYLRAGHTLGIVASALGLDTPPEPTPAPPDPLHDRVARLERALRGELDPVDPEDRALWKDVTGAPMTHELTGSAYGPGRMFRTYGEWVLHNRTVRDGERMNAIEDRLRALEGRFRRRVVRSLPGTRRYGDNQS